MASQSITGITHKYVIFRKSPVPGSSEPLINCRAFESIEEAFEHAKLLSMEYNCEAVVFELKGGVKYEPSYITYTI